jgi:hypothetical protein
MTIMTPASTVNATAEAAAGIMMMAITIIVDTETAIETFLFQS